MINTKFLIGNTVKLSDKVKKYMGSSRDGTIYELVLVQEFYNRMMERSEEPTFIDIGANTGSYALIPLVNKKIKCYAFEPNKYAFNVLKENVELNNISDSVELYNNGLWSEEKTLKLKIPIDTTDSGLSTFGENPSRFKYNQKDGKYVEEEVKCLTLDGLVSEKKLKIDAIKIDTEGSELDILKGGRKFLEEQKPMLLLEYDDKNTEQFNYSRNEIKEYLSDIGYKNFTMFKLSDIFVY